MRGGSTLSMVSMGSVVVLVMALSAGCGSGVQDSGLGEWLGPADAACDDELSEVGGLAETPADAAANADALTDAFASASQKVADLEPPTGDDGEAVSEFLGTINGVAEDQAAAVEASDDGTDDFAYAAAFAELDADAAAEQAEALGLEDCTARYRDAADSISTTADTLEALGAVSEIRVGDCTSDNEDEIEAAECTDDAAAAEVLTTELTDEFDCGSDSDISRSFSQSQGDVSVAAGVCLASLGPSPEEVDNVWDIGSCVASDDPNEDPFTGVEVACDDPTATLEVTDDVGVDDTCPGADDVGILHSDEEVDLFGEGSWCLSPL